MQLRVAFLRGMIGIDKRAIASVVIRRPQILGPHIDFHEDFTRRPVFRPLPVNYFDRRRYLRSYWSMRTARPADAKFTVHHLRQRDPKPSKPQRPGPKPRPTRPGGEPL